MDFLPSVKKYKYPKANIQPEVAAWAKKWKSGVFPMKDKAKNPTQKVIAYFLAIPKF